jgi:hypothetical protein
VVPMWLEHYTSIGKMCLLQWKTQNSKKARSFLNSQMVWWW